MLKILIGFLIFQIDTIEIKFRNQISLIESYPEEAERIMQEWLKEPDTYFPYLLKEFTSPKSSIFIKQKIAITFGKMKKEEALPHLYNYLKSTSSTLRTACAEAIGEIGNPESSSYLIPLLQDKHDAVRGAAISSLGKLKDKNAVTPLILYSLNDPSFVNRARAIVSLSEIGDKSALSYIIKFKNDENEIVRASVAKAITNFKDPQFLSILEELYKDREPIVRKEALIAMSEFESEIFYKNLKKAIKDSSYIVRAGIPEIISSKPIPPETSITILYQLLNDPEKAVKEKVISTLNLIKTNGVKGFLFIMKGNYPIEQKRWAIENLISILGQKECMNVLLKEFPQWDKKKVEKIVTGQIEKGMTKEEVYLSIGKPSRTRKMGEIEEWDYDNLNKTLKFKEGVLIGEKGF